MEKREFKAESRRLLDLMIHSIYTNKEIFLREIISNASDAIDKLSYLSLTDETVPLRREDFEIRLTLDKAGRCLTVSDNGVGMNAEDLENNLGVIAHSGSAQFRQALERGDTELIGQFGVGFYSAFMVSDRVTVVTRKHGDEQAWRWVSDDADGYTIEPWEREAAGTDVIMHIRPDGEEQDEYSRYLREYPIYKLVKKYSDYIRWPIRMLMPQPQIKEGSTKENPEFEEVFELETFNSMAPIWQRKRGDVPREEYDRYYQEHFGETTAPLSVLTASVEGAVTYQALLYVPAKAPEKYGTDDDRPGLELYCAGVKVMDRCADLLPEEFDFVRGVVDSPDLSLNISRELLQHDRQLKLIGANLAKRVRGELERLLREEREQYEAFWQSFGRHLKICALDNYGAKKETLQDLLLFWSSTERKLVTLPEYVSRMPEEQKYIYYAAGAGAQAVDHMPQTERLKERGMEILYFTDRTDEFVADMFRDYQGKQFRSAVDGDLELDGEEKKDETGAYQEAFGFIKDCLGERVTEVKASTRLKTHPVCLSSGAGISFDMERYFKAVQPELGMKAKRVLEINVDHPAFAAFEHARIVRPETAKRYAEIYYNQALLIAGLPVEDPSGYTDLLLGLWQ